jgi:hypothetical protein
MKTLIVAVGVCSLAYNTQAGPALGTMSPFTLGIQQCVGPFRTDQSENL